VKRRWLLWSAVIGLIALIALFPLRTALGLSDFRRIGFTARQVAGTIWYGRIGDLQLRSQPLGTFEVQLNPVALLLGKISMTFNRMEDPNGVLKGRLIAGLSRGVEAVDGRLQVGDMFAPLPVRALDFRDMTVRFQGGRCVEAKGKVTPVIAAPVPGFDFAGLTGAIECDGERARVRMAPGGRQSIEFYVHSSGSYRGWITVRDLAPPLAGALGLVGFKPTSEGMTLSVDGQL
jgi:general secretion pathway protein N